MILSTAYLPNLQYLSKFIIDEPLVEAHENFQKQSYRNRAEIMTAEGVRPLVVPILWQHNEKMAVRDVRIDNRDAWQRTHLRTLRAAYASSVYFEHYIQNIEPFFTKTYTYLWDLNCETTSALLAIFGLPSVLSFTADYQRDAAADLRNSISPKARLQKEDPDFMPNQYYQVFSERQPFVPNLSALDYLFCEGANLDFVKK